MTQKIWLIAAGALVIAQLGGEHAQAAEGMRCGPRLVSTGDPQYVVQERCGPPDAVSQRMETRRVTDVVQMPCPSGMCARAVERTVEVMIEEWTYDFGKRRFLQFVQFVNGRVDRVVSGGYGYKDI